MRRRLSARTLRETSDEGSCNSPLHSRAFGTPDPFPVWEAGRTDATRLAGVVAVLSRLREEPLGSGGGRSYATPSYCTHVEGITPDAGSCNSPLQPRFHPGHCFERRGPLFPAL